MVGPFLYWALGPNFQKKETFLDGRQVGLAATCITKLVRRQNVAQKMATPAPLTTMMRRSFSHEMY